MPPVTLSQLALISEWPLYVTDEGRVTCNHGGCAPDADGFLWRTSGRRIDLAEFLWALHTHATTEHE
jgi:hypothetical protein